MKRLIFRFLIALLTFIIGVVAFVLVSRSYQTLKVAKIYAPVGVDISTGITKDQKETDDAIARTIANLRQIKVDNGYSFNNLPSTAKPLLTMLKHQLRELVYETLNVNYPQRDSRLLQAHIINVLRENGISVDETEETLVDDNYMDDSYTYGDIYSIGIQKPLGHPDLLAVTTEIGVCCGSDTSLYLFRDNGKHWELILAQESNNYDDISGAQGSFQYAISPPDKKNEFFVVVANVNPWCISNWQSLRYKVLRPGKSASEPRILLSKNNSIYLGVDDPVYTLNVQSTGFSLSFQSDETDMDVLNKGKEVDWEISERVVKYRIVGERATRIQK
jgi:hypothetical protein